MKITKDFFPLYTGFDLSRHTLPYLLADSGHDGPTLCLTGGMHGNEVTGTAVIFDVFEQIAKTSLTRGRIVAFPVLNFTGFDAITRSIFYDGVDLNRNFPGNAKGTEAERYAWRIMEAIRSFSPDYLLDLHTDALHSLPYSLVDELGSEVGVDPAIYWQSALLAESLSLPWVIGSSSSHTFQFTQFLAGCAIAAGIPTVTLELGGPIVVNQSACAAGVEAILGLCDTLGMLGPISKPMKTELPAEIWVDNVFVRTDSNGFVEYQAAVGSLISKGQILAIVRNIFGEPIESLPSPVDGIFLSHEDRAICLPGSSLLYFAQKRPREEFGL